MQNKLLKNICLLFFILTIICTSCFDNNSDSEDPKDEVSDLPCRFYGLVVDTSNLPIYHIEISIKVSSGSVYESTYTDKSGKYSIEVSEPKACTKTVQVWASDGGWEDNNAYQPKVEMDVQNTPGGSIEVNFQLLTIGEVALEG